MKKILNRFVHYYCTTISLKCYRGSHSEVFYKIGVLNKFAKFTENTYCITYNFL